MPYDLFSLAEKEGITIEYWDFKPPLEAVYWKNPGLPPIIGLSNSLLKEKASYFRCVLAEELGHHFTTAGNALPQTLFHYRGRLDVNRAEYRALRWAALYLIPGNKFQQALCSYLKNTWELAEHFNITEEMMKFRLELLIKQGYFC